MESIECEFPGVPKQEETSPPEDFNELGIPSVVDISANQNRMLGDAPPSIVI